MLPPLTAWFVTFLVHSTLLGLGALLALRFLRRPAARVVVLRGAVLGGLVTASLAGAWSRGAEVVLPAPEPSSPAPVIALEPPRFRPVPVAVPSTRPVRATAEVVGPAPSVTVGPLPWRRWLVTWFPLALLAAGGFGATRLLLRERRARRALTGRRRLEGEDLPLAIRALLGRRKSVRLSVSTRVASPLALGRREVVLPERALVELGEDELEALVAHELAHLERGDPTWLGVVRVAAAVTWFQPLAHVLVRRLADETELAADAHAVARTQRPLALARCLERVGAWLVDEPSPAAAATMGRAGGPLVRRVEALVVRGAVETRGTRLAVAGTLAALVAFACAGPAFQEAPDDVREDLGPVAQSFVDHAASTEAPVLTVWLFGDEDAPPDVRFSMDGIQAPVYLREEWRRRGAAPYLLEPIHRANPETRVVVHATAAYAPRDVAVVVEEIVQAGFTNIDLEGPPGVDGARFEAETSEALVDQLGGMATNPGPTFHERLSSIAAPGVELEDIARAVLTRMEDDPGFRYAFGGSRRHLFVDVEPDGSFETMELVAGVHRIGEHADAAALERHVRGLAWGWDDASVHLRQDGEIDAHRATEAVEALTRAGTRDVRVLGTPVVGRAGRSEVESGESEEAAAKASPRTGTVSEAGSSTERGLETLSALGYAEDQRDSPSKALPQSLLVPLGILGLGGEERFFALYSWDVEGGEPGEVRYVLHLDAEGRAYSPTQDVALEVGSTSFLFVLKTLSEHMSSRLEPVPKGPRTLPADRLQLRVHPDAPVAEVLHLLEGCAKRDVEIGKVELADLRGDVVVEAFLPAGDGPQEMEEVEWPEEREEAEVAEDAAPPETPIEVHLGERDGRARYRVGPKLEVSANDAAASAAQAHGDEPVRLRVDRGVTYGSLLPLVAALAERDVPFVFLAPTEAR